MIDYAAEIKNAVPMRAVVDYYGFEVNRGNKVLCPFHGDKNNSLHIYPKRYHCFACGAYGDAIDFVSQYFNIPFLESIKKINTDFSLGLPIGEKLSDEAQKKANRQAYQRRKERERRQNELKRLLTAYHAAYDWYAALDIIALWDAPKTPEDEITPQYAYAVKHIDAAWEEVQDAAERLREFDRKGE